VHERLVKKGIPPRLRQTKILLHHDGNLPQHALPKALRNDELIRLELEVNRDSARWLHQDVMNGSRFKPLPLLVDQVRRLVEHARLDEDDPLDLDVYRRLALVAVCTRCLCDGDAARAALLTDMLAKVEGPHGHDHRYFAWVATLLSGDLPDVDDILEFREEHPEFPGSYLSTQGAHVDAVILSCLRRLDVPDLEEEYRTACTPWTDAFFDDSVLRGWPAV
jgi:hypothetical protein